MLNNNVCNYVIINIERMNQEVEIYIYEGCGRCSYHNTPKCKVNAWTDELLQLRKIALDCGLAEDFNYSPCYTFNNNNILKVSAFKQYVSISFFNGDQLQDKNNILVSSTEIFRTEKQIKFTSLKEILNMESTIKEYILEAVDIK